MRKKAFNTILKEEKPFVLAPIAVASFFGDGAAAESPKKIERKAGLDLERGENFLLLIIKIKIYISENEINK